MPSSSARCAQLPRALDKVPFYLALRKFRDYLKGTIDHISEEEMTFAHVKLKNFKKEEKLVEDEEDGDALSNDSLPDASVTRRTPDGSALAVPDVKPFIKKEDQSKYFSPSGAY